MKQKGGEMERRATSLTTFAFAFGFTWFVAAFVILLKAIISVSLVSSSALFRSQFGSSSVPLLCSVWLCLPVLTFRANAMNHIDAGINCRTSGIEFFHDLSRWSLCFCPILCSHLHAFLALTKTSLFNTATFKTDYLHMEVMGSRSSLLDHSFDQNEDFIFFSFMHSRKWKEYTMSQIVNEPNQRKTEARAHTWPCLKLWVCKC